MSGWNVTKAWTNKNKCNFIYFCSSHFYISFFRKHFSTYDEWSWIIHEEIVILIKYISFCGSTVCTLQHIYSTIRLFCHKIPLNERQLLYLTCSPSNYKDIENDARPFNHWSYTYWWLLLLIFLNFYFRIIPIGDTNIEHWIIITAMEKQKRNHFRRKLKCQGSIYTSIIVSAQLLWL